MREFYQLLEGKIIHFQRINVFFCENEVACQSVLFKPCRRLSDGAESEFSEFTYIFFSSELSVVSHCAACAFCLKKEECRLYYETLHNKIFKNNFD